MSRYSEHHNREKGSVILITVFMIALLSAAVVSILQLNTEEIQIMSNEVNAAEAIFSAKAGLNDAFSELRNNSGWDAGFSGKAFDGGSYTVSVTGTSLNLNIVSTAVTSRGFTAKVQAGVTLSASSPYAIRVNSLRVNE